MASKRTNYILIDRENVTALEFGEMVGRPVRVLIFVGEKQTKLPVEDVEKMLQHKDHVELIRMAGSGHNALDFHIAFHAGRISAQDPHARIHVVSRDKGFDPLIEHLGTLRVPARRWEKVSDIDILHTPDIAALSLEQRVSRVVERLKSSPQARPRKRKTLVSSIQSWFAREIGDAEVTAIIEELQRTKKLQVQTGDAVSYSL